MTIYDRILINAYMPYFINEPECKKTCPKYNGNKKDNEVSKLNCWNCNGKGEIEKEETK